MVLGCLASVSVAVVGSWLSGVGGYSWFLVVGCRWLYLVPGCRVSVVVVCSWLSGVGGCSWFLDVECRYLWL